MIPQPTSSRSYLYPFRVDFIQYRVNGFFQFIQFLLRDRLRCGPLQRTKTRVYEPTSAIHTLSIQRQAIFFVHTSTTLCRYDQRQRQSRSAQPMPDSLRGHNLYSIHIRSIHSRSRPYITAVITMENAISAFAVSPAPYRS